MGLGLAGSGSGRRRWEWLLRVRGFLWRWWNIPKSTVMMIVHLCDYAKKNKKPQGIVHFKWVNYMLNELFLNKAVIRENSEMVLGALGRLRRLSNWLDFGSGRVLGVLGSSLMSGSVHAQQGVCSLLDSLSPSPFPSLVPQQVKYMGMDPMSCHSLIS